MALAVISQELNRRVTDKIKGENLLYNLPVRKSRERVRFQSHFSFISDQSRPLYLGITILVYLSSL